MPDSYLIAPDPGSPRLTRAVEGVDHEGRAQAVRVVEERPLTIYLNAQEIVTAMTIGDYPRVPGGRLPAEPGHAAARRRDSTGVDYDDELGDRGGAHRRGDRLRGEAAQEDPDLRLRGRHGVRRHDGGARGARRCRATPVRTSDLYALAHAINTTPSLYLEAGAIHGTVLCEGARPLVYMEDVGRHNAVDKIAGWMAMRGRAARRTRCSTPPGG